MKRRKFLLGGLGLGASAQASPPWFSAFVDVQNGFSWTDMKVFGEIPHDIYGTMMRVGPMRFHSPDGERYGHWFDGDGGVVSVRIDSGKAQCSMRVLSSQGLQKEQQAKKRIFSGYDTPAKNAWWNIIQGQFKNVANTNIVHFDDRWMALVESSGPTSVDPETLSITDEHPQQRIMKGGFSAHPHRQAGSHVLYNIGVEIGLKSNVYLYAMLPGGHMERLCRIAGIDTPIIHDFILTQRYAVLLVPPLSVDLIDVLRSEGRFASNIHWNASKGTQVVVIDLAEPKKNKRFYIDPFYSWHIGNAFDYGSDIVVDLVRYDDFSSSQALGGIIRGESNHGALQGKLSRLVIHMSSQTATHQGFGSLSMEFPQVSPLVFAHRHRRLYACAHSTSKKSKEGLHDRVVQMDMDTGKEKVLDCGEGYYSTEPMVIPKRQGAGEWVLSLCYDAVQDRSALVIFDGESSQNTPIAQLTFPQVVPFTFHGSWKQEYG